MRVAFRVAGLLQAHIGSDALGRASGGLFGQGFGAMRGMAHRDVGDDAFGAIPVFGDQVGRKPHAWLLLYRVDRHGVRIGAGGACSAVGAIDALIQGVALMRADDLRQR